MNTNSLRVRILVEHKRLVVDGFQKTESRNRYATVEAFFVSYSTFSLYRYITKRNRRRKWEDVPKDVVLVHTLPKGRLAPNVSPFVLKLETYLRLANPYQVMIPGTRY
ncbi:uncharacterized protein LOC122250153 [Penaeus japonicus]|uniref:uncharacterized protein LOC122250153 n=1 Tax=Penaeus japonicus TaxID=27405 RepID=UPI001C71380C|nr:uncharacterized protein LOC122250153 [Penaeus japonicus]